MKITNVAVEDFLSIGKTEFCLDGRGLVLVQGLNQDNGSASSNGSGKSSLLDALCWGLYGETARGVPANQVVRNGAKKARVSVTFVTDSGQTCVVQRERSKTKSNLTFHIETPTGSVPLTAGTDKLTQQEITRMLGASYEVFRSAVYIGQEQMPDLPGMTDKRLKELIEEAAGVGVIEAAYAEARAEHKELGGKVELVEAGLAAIEANITRLVAEREDLQAKVTAWNVERNTRIRLADQEAKDIAIEMSNLMAAGSGITAPLPTIKAALAAVEAKIAGFTTAQTEERRLDRELAEANRQRVTADSKAALARSQVQEIEEAIEAIKASEGKMCNHCGEPMSAHGVASALATATARRAKLSGAAAGAAAAAATAAAGVAAAEAALAAHRATMGDPSKLQSQAMTLRAAIRKHEAHETQVLEVQGRLSRQTTVVEAIRAEINPYDTLVIAKRAAVEKTVEERVEAQKGLEVARQALEEAAEVVQVFSPAGVRAQVLDRVTPYLNDRTAAYLSLLSDGALGANWTTLVKTAKGDLKEQFAIEISHPAGEGFAGLSGGEKRKIRLACGMALQDLVASRASKPFLLWVLDECDEALDDAALERLMAILNEKAREKGTVLVISHHSLTDWISQVWTVTKTKGVSALSGHV